MEGLRSQISSRNVGCVVLFWKDATTNPAVAMLYRQYTVQQPYLSNYHSLAELHKTRLVGLTNTPFEPIGLDDGLPKFAEILCGAKGIKTGVLKP